MTDPTPSKVDPTHAVAAQFISYWEGFAGTAYWDVNHYRLGFGSDTEGPEQVSVTKGMTTTRDRAMANLTLRIPQYEETAIKQLGADLYDKLGLNTKVAIIDICYNYGDLPDSILSAFKTNSSRVAHFIRLHETDNKSVNRDRRASEAALVLMDGGQIA